MAKRELSFYFFTFTTGRVKFARFITRNCAGFCRKNFRSGRYPMPIVKSSIGCFGFWGVIMRIAFLFDNAPLATPETLDLIAYSWIRGLAESQHDVKVVTRVDHLPPEDLGA